YDPRRHALVLFGGLGATGMAFADTWIYGADGTWSLLHVQSAPTARSSAGLAYDYFRDALELYGGKDSASGQALSDLWGLPGGRAAWRPLPSSPPVPVVVAPHLLFDGRNTLLVGSDELNMTEVKIWRSDPGVFTEIMPMAANSAPTQRSDFAAAFDREAGT